MRLIVIILFFTHFYNANSSLISWQKRANELALMNFIGTNSIGGYVQPNNHVVIQNVPKHGTASTSSWPAELPKSYASKSMFTLPPVRYEEDKTGLIGSFKRKMSSSSEDNNKVQKTTTSTIKEAIVKQRNKPQRVQSLAHGRVEDAKWEKIYFSAATGAAVIAKKVYDQSKNAANPAKEKCLVACESFKKSVSFGRSTSANASKSKFTSLNKSTRFNKQRSLNTGRSFSKSQSLSRKIVTQGRTIVKRDLTFIKRSNSESQGSKEEENNHLTKNQKVKDDKQVNR